MAPKLVDSVLQWLRAGYPTGIPPKDYTPLLALLQRTLTEDEVRLVVRTLIASAADRDEAGADPSPTAQEVQARIAEVTHTPASEDDVRRVSALLAAAGWPLAGAAQH